MHEQTVGKEERGPKVSKNVQGTTNKSTKTKMNQTCFDKSSHRNIKIVLYRLTLRNAKNMQEPKKIQRKKIINKDTNEIINDNKFGK